MRSFRILLPTLVLAILAAPAAAQDDEVHCRVAPGAHTVICDPIDIEGAAPRPFVLLTRSRNEDEAPPLERHFTREIARTVERGPF